ncbi:MAG: DUF1524 domain-containing protein, partial [Chitinophagaceae bacterium]
FEHNEDYLQDTGIMIKTLVAFATNQSKYKTVGRVPLESFHTSWEKAKSGLRFAINFLKSNVLIENLTLLSSPFLLIPIAYYAVRKKEKLSEEECNKLLLWFYAAHMKGHYSYGSSEGFLDADLSIINRTENIDELLAVLKSHIKDFDVTAEELTGKNRRSPYFSMLFFIAKQKKVKDWFTGIGVSEKLTGRSHALQFHHIFPKSLLRDLGYGRRELNDIANLAFINGKTNRSISNKSPEVYLKGIVEKQGPSALKDQLISLDESEWKLSVYNNFLIQRRNLLVNAINTHLKQLM